MRAALDPCFDMMHSVLDMRGLSWDFKQWAVVLKGERRAYRLQQCWDGVFMNAFFLQLDFLFFGADRPASPWHTILPQDVTSGPPAPFDM